MSDHGWLPFDDAARWCGVDQASADEAQLAAVRDCRNAAAGYVEERRPELFTDDALVAPGDTVYMAALIATKRLHQRHTSGSFQEFGGAVAILELDPDVAVLLGTAKPSVG